MYRLRSLLVLSFVACSPNTSSVGQRITCETDPDSGTILSCQPGEGDGDANTCEDVDEDGDGQPADDDGTIARTSSIDEDDDGIDDDQDVDDDNDGIDDDDDCDEEEGEDGDESELPYDVRMQLGDTVTPIVDAFAEKGGQPDAILSVVMDGGGTGWRLTELQAGTTFTVDANDCSHIGNRDIGRDRVLVTWRNADGSSETDHLDLRYCE